MKRMKGSPFDSSAEAKVPSWEIKENPQAYDQSPFYFVHKNPTRNMLGIVGGNDVSVVKGNQVDLESDLRRLNIPNTFCPSRQYQPPRVGNEGEIVRDNVKTKQTVNTKMSHLPATQAWAYPVSMGPTPLRLDACSLAEAHPEKY